MVIRYVPFRFSCVPVGGYEDIGGFREEVLKSSLVRVKAKVANKETVGWINITTCALYMSHGEGVFIYICHSYKLLHLSPIKYCRQFIYALLNCTCMHMHMTCSLVYTCRVLPSIWGPPHPYMKVPTS